jgi:hypothetical protein
VAVSACALYRPRRPQATPLYRLVQACYADVRNEWEEQYEGRYSFWRGFTDKAVGGYLDCGILENGFARVRCGACHAEFLVAFSCKGRRLCPSCAAKRAAALLFRHQVFSFLQAECLLSEERTRLLLSWRHSGLRGHRDTVADSNTQPPSNRRSFGRTHCSPRLAPHPASARSRCTPR